MKTAFLVLIALGVLTSFSSLASFERAQGGEALFCPLQKPIALEIFENENMGGVPPVYSFETKAEDKAADVISRLENLDPARAQRWMDWAQSFYKDASFLAASPTITDKSSCSVQMVLMRRKYSKLNPEQYQIFEKLWNALDEDQKSVLIVREVIHRDLAESNFKFTDSDIRIFSQMLFSDALQNLSLDQYIPVLRSLHFGHFKVSGLSLLLTDDIKIQDGFVTAGTLSSVENITKPFFTLNCSSRVLFPLGKITLAQNGNLQSFVASPELLRQPACYPHFYDNHVGIFVGHTWLFGADEKPLVIQGSTAQIQKLKIDYSFLQFRANGKASSAAVALPTLYKFDEDFRLREISLGGGACRAKNGEIRFFADLASGAASVLLEENGALRTKLSTCP